ncbi:MAG TPA: GDP-mannose 4,6-dehydratase [Nitrososphaerales archaeon]|nr:GDP-mannose 4,6-dehydratase [Nitrososphaerales archaeon]HUK75262.1 GDP-mannose 4,6-dehydratase [Nitrososphaerales archaeon]
MRRALITGITGQDGAYLAQFLLGKGYEVYGAFRRLSTPNFWRLQSLGIHDKVKLISVDLIDMGSMIEAMTVSQPHEVYHLAAQSFVGSSFDQPLATADMTGVATTRMLESIRLTCKDAKFYQASTSELYGNSPAAKDEEAPLMPRSPYAASKLYAYWITRIYRESYNIFACNGILFNHESPLRGLEFVSRKVTNAAARIHLGLQERLTVGNLEAERDWGYAPDYVRSMWMMMQQETPGDYVIATGRAHSVRELVSDTFEALGMDYQRYVDVDKRLLRPLEVDRLKGNPAKARRELKWAPTVGFDELIDRMVKEDVKRWKNWQDGKAQPWDAPLYPEDLEIIITRYSLDR